MTSKDRQPPISATDYIPIDSSQTESKLGLSFTAIFLIIAATCTLIILVYQSLARAVIFDIQPDHANVDIKGLSFNIGENYLLLAGDYSVNISANGYHSSEFAIKVTEEATQSFDFTLEPLPGNLNINSDLKDINVTIDNNRHELAPGLIEGISRGSHQLNFTKYRYFPLTQQIDIIGMWPQNVELNQIIKQIT